MPYQRESDKQAQQQQQPQMAGPEQIAAPSASPAAAAGSVEESMGQRQVVRGAPDLNAPNDAYEGFRMAQETVRPGAGAAMGDEQPATEGEQREYERAVNALGNILYSNEQGTTAILKQLTPQEKVGSIAKASILTIQQLDKKYDFDEVVIPALTQETVDRIIDLYENQHGEELSDVEAQRAFGAAWEGVMELYGADESDYAELTAGMSEEDFRGYEQEYKGYLGEA